MNVNGRLLTIDGISLIPQDTPQVNATIAATAFVLPAVRVGDLVVDGRGSVRPAASSSIEPNPTSSIGVDPMKQLRDILSDLVERRLWPVALGLVVALVAVPVVLGRGGARPAGHAGDGRDGQADTGRPRAPPRRPR